MRCRSCSENIDSKYRHALSSNVCPICGQKLLSDALFNFRIKVTHILETHEVSNGKIDLISTEVMNAIMRAFTEDKQPGLPSPTPEQKQAQATHDKGLVKYGSDTVNPEISELEASPDADLTPREYGDDDPNNPENKEFLKEIGWDPESTSTLKDAVRPKINPLVKKIPSPISRLS